MRAISDAFPRRCGRAEGVGFEPTGLVKGQGFSRASHSSALPSLRNGQGTAAPGQPPSPTWARRSSTQASASRQAASAFSRTAGPCSPAAGIGAEELHAGELRVQDAQAVGDHLVGDVAFEVDEKAVVAQTPFGRA